MILLSLRAYRIVAEGVAAETSKEVAHGHATRRLRQGIPADRERGDSVRPVSLP